MHALLLREFQNMMHQVHHQYPVAKAEKPFEQEVLYKILLEVLGTTGLL